MPRALVLAIALAVASSVACGGPDERIIDAGARDDAQRATDAAAARPALDASASPCPLAVAPGTIGLWCFHEGEGAVAYSTVGGAPTVVQIAGGEWAKTGGLRLVASGAVILDHGIFELPRGFTLEVAFTALSIPPSGSVLVERANAGKLGFPDETWLRVTIGAGGEVACDVGTAGGSGQRATSPPGIVKLGVPVVVACQRDSSGAVRVLSEGRDVTATRVGTPSPGALAADEPMRIGWSGCEVCPEARFFDGLFRGLALYARRPDGPFTLVALPDTQYYVSGDGERLHFLASQLAWIADNRDRMNIPFVVHEGDCTNSNGDSQWLRFREAMAALDAAEVEYALALGNHDVGDNADSRDTALNDYFATDVQAGQSFGGSFRPGRLDNAYYYFAGGGIDWLVFSLEFGPRDEVLEWTEQIALAHPQHRIIIVTHAYVFSDDTLYGPGDEWSPHDYAIDYATGVNDGAEMWTDLVSQLPNASVVLSGHVLNDGTGLVVDTGDLGNTVYQMLANYQNYGDGGDGFMRILIFDPTKRRIAVRTYSPDLRVYRTEPDQHFDLTTVDFFP